MLYVQDGVGSANETMNFPMDRFYWLNEGKLAGCSQPGRRDLSARVPVSADLEWLVGQGFLEVLTLTEEPLPDSHPELTIHHIPVADMTAPTLGQITSAVQIIAIAFELQHPIAVHCHGGLGRTGTILAAYLVSTGHSPADSIAAIRAICPEAIETVDQERILSDFASSELKSLQE